MLLVQGKRPISDHGRRCEDVHFSWRILCLFLLAVAVAADGQQVTTYPHNAVGCERCHDIPLKFGGSSMTIERMGTSVAGRFVSAAEGGIHHRSLASSPRPWGSATRQPSAPSRPTSPG